MENKKIYNEVIKDESYLNKILADGQDAADAVAEVTLKSRILSSLQDYPNATECTKENMVI